MDTRDNVKKSYDHKTGNNEHITGNNEHESAKMRAKHFHKKVFLL